MGSRSRLSRSICVLIVVLTLVSLFPHLSPQLANAGTSLHYLYGSGSTTGGKRITLRVELTEPAPSTGKRVAFTSSHPSIPLPSSIKVPAGETEYTFTVTTKPVERDTGVTVTARVGTVTKSRVVVIKAPVLGGLSVQSRIRAGGYGKVTVLLTGRAPAKGVAVELESSRSDILSLPSLAIVTAGRTSISLVIPAAMVTDDVAVRVVARLGGKSIARDTIVRNYGDPTEPTTTATATASPTITTGPESPTATSTATAHPTSTPTATGTAPATATQTPIPVDPVTIELVSGSVTVLWGSTVEFQVCLTEVSASQRFVSFSSNNPSVVDDADVVPGQWILPAGSSGAGLCTTIEMTGRTIDEDENRIGEVNLRANLEGTDYLSPVIQFVPPAPTATETAAPTATATDVPTATATPSSTATSTPHPTATPSETSTSTSTPAPTATQTPTATATNTATASPTATHTATIAPPDPVSFTVTSGSSTVERGDTVVFDVCLTQDASAQVFLSFASNDLNVVQDSGVAPTFLTIGPGQVGPQLCGSVSMTGRTDGNNGIGVVQLRVFLGQYYYSDPITFIAPPPTATETSTSTATATEMATPSATATSTSEPTETSAPTATPTQAPTSTPTVTAVPSSTPAESPTSTATNTPIPTATFTPAPTATVPIDPVVITLTGSSDLIPRGGTAEFSVCLSGQHAGQGFITLSSSDLFVVDDSGISPSQLFLQPGACEAVSMTGRTASFGTVGLGPVQLKANLNGTTYYGPVVTFVVP